MNRAGLCLPERPGVERDVTDDVEHWNYYNAALLIAPTGEITHSYYKSHLVPFGEYVPLQRYLWFLQPLVEAAGNFSPGVVEAPLVAGEIKAGVLICFESIFPEIGRAWVNQGANVLVNITNDAWYGRSSRPASELGDECAARRGDQAYPGTRRQYRDFRGGQPAGTHRSPVRYL